MDFTTYEPRISALEAGGGGGEDFYIINENQGVLDKTWKEIHDAVEDKPGHVLLYGARDPYPMVVTAAAKKGKSYTVSIAFRMISPVEQSAWYFANSPDEYPIAD